MSNASAPPSAFVRSSSYAEMPSTPMSSGKSKRHSLNIVSSSSAGPRPLHLALGSVIGSSPNSPSPESAAHNTGEVGSRYSPQASPRTLALPLSPTVAGLRSGSSRRQSSISYLPANSPSSSQKRQSVDILSLGLARSPLSSPYTDVNGEKVRSSSLGGTGSRSPVPGEQFGTGSIATDSEANVKEKPPVILAEKHADLLHFIAQKESKCLELRSQLALHEAELLQLKKKWERIVNRGFEKSLSTTSSLSPSSAFSPGLSPSSSDSSTVNNPSYFPALTPTTNASSAIVLEGLKEGVQGMSRLLAAGFGSIAQVNAPENKHPTASDSSTPPSAGPLPFRLGHASHRKPPGSGHEQKESQSSCSTTTSAASSATFSSLLSAATASSVTSAGSSAGSSASGNTTTKRSSMQDSIESDSEFGDFEDGQTRRQDIAAARGRRKEKEPHEHVLMVRDTGATPTMSPNPEFQRRRRRASDESKVQELPSTKADQGAADDSMKADFDWDDGWADFEGDTQAGDLRADTAKSMSRNSEAGSAAARALAPISSIPGLGAAGMGVAVSTPSTQQMSSWVGSVGKKWDEIKGSDTFTKNQKRATLLLSDMQQSLVSALISPSPESASLHKTPAAVSSSSLAFSSNAYRPPQPPSSTKSTTRTQPAAPRGMSLIDDSDDESFGEGAESEADNTVRLTMAAPVMVPVAVTQVSSVGAAKEGARTKNAKMVKTDDTEEDEWNW